MTTTRPILKTVFLLALFSSYIYAKEPKKNFLGEDEEISIEDYDTYVLSIQWGNTLCLMSDGCKDKLRTIPKNIFTLHGLWPSLKDGRRLPECNSGSKISVEIQTKELLEKMNTFWLSYTSPNEHFWDHEYNTHGYCYTEKEKEKSPEAFFSFTMDLFERLDLDDVIIKTFGQQTGEIEFDYEDLQQHLGTTLKDLKYEFDCHNVNKKQYLQEIRFVFDLELKPTESTLHSQCDKTKPIIVIME